MGEPKVEREHVEVVEDDREIHGRAIQQQEHSRTYWQTLQQDPKLLGWIALMLWMLIIRGFENQASGTLISVTQFKRRFGVEDANGDYFIDTKWQSAVSGGPLAAGIIGAWVASILADLFGFKWVLIGASSINLASIGIEFASTSIQMFFAGKMVNFLAIGILQNLCTAYVADIAPLAIRASAIGFCNLSQCIGPFICAIMANSTGNWTSDWSWKSLVCAQWGFAGVGYVFQFFMPESPVHLVKINKLDKASNVLNRLYRDPSDAEGHLERIKITLAEAETNKEGSSFLECFRGSNLRRTIIAIIPFLGQGMAGLAFVNSYGPLMYQYMGVSDKKSFQIQIGSQILSISGAILSFLISDFVGRRVMFITGCSAISAVLFSMAIAGCFPEVPSAATAAVGFLTMYNFFFNAGVGSMAYILAGEVPTSVLRTKTLAISMCFEQAVLTMWTFVCPYIINPGYGNLNAKVGFIFGALMVVWVVLAFFLIPETRGRTYEELDEMFMNKVPARKFRKYKTVAEARAAESYQVEHKNKEMYEYVEEA